MDVAGLQIGTVTNNQDPSQMGRVQVSLPDTGGMESSSWAPVLQSQAGSNYGVYFVPEVGDQVLVGFLANNQDHPVVIGALFASGQAKSYDSDNYKKTIITKGANSVAFYDKPGEESITIANTDNGNSIVMDMQKKTITISSPSQIVMDAPAILLKGSSIKINGGDVRINTTNSYTDCTGQTWSADQQGSLIISTDNDMRAHVTGVGTVISDGNLNLGSNQDLTVSGKTSVAVQSDIGGVTVSAATTADIKANMQMTVESTGQTAIKGLMVMIN